MSKIKVLVIPSDRTGVGKFRSVDPHIFLQNQYGDEFHVDIVYDPPMDTNYYKDYHIVHYHRNIGPDFEKGTELAIKLKDMGIVTICDIDDYWMPTKDHPIHDIIRVHKINEKIIASLKVAKHITTTTSLFADEISKFHKSVFVLPNAINPNEPQFMEPTIPSDKLRFGWLGGSSHLHDLGLMRGFTDAIGQEFRDKSQIFICGFDTRGTMTEINAQTGEQKQRDILPQETVWARYEEIFTKNYEFTTPQYKDYLLKFRQEKWNGDEQYYNRVWTEPVTSYAKNYAKFDVSLAPIMNHMFNRVKSQLKVIEAGFYKKAIVASNIGPYTLDLKHSLQNGNFVDGNAILVDEKRNHADWAKAMKKLIQNPTWAADLGERLYETVKDKYDLNIVTDHRAQLYKSLK